MKTLRAVDLGRIAYREAWELQRSLVAARAAGTIPDLLLFCEHPEVVTVGRRAQTPGRDAVAEVAGASAAGIPVEIVERGGAATYHGPGQLVGYPIVQLGEGERDLHAFLRNLEGALIDTLGGFGLEAGRNDGFTGVWSQGRKLASIGIACRSWVTYHGFALNLETDLSRFSLFTPCDLEGSVMASVSSLGGSAEREAIQRNVHAALADRLSRRPVWGDLPEA